MILEKLTYEKKKNKISSAFAVAVAQSTIYENFKTRMFSFTNVIVKSLIA